MLSVQACSGSMAGSYFADAEENYYTRDQSAADEWQGKLCEKLGLQDGAAVKAEDFQVILSARGSKCAGYDLTFSAPKSVSIVSQIGTDTARRDMMEAHREAVTATLKEIEQHEIYTRARINGEITPIQTKEMAVAKFEHNLSRNLDPQLHTHAFVANMTNYNGKLYAVDGARLYQVQKIYGAEYRARLAQNLRARGYEITITDSEKGFFELGGMNQKDMELFSTRRAEILADMEARGVSGAAEAQLSTLGTRQTKEKDVDQEQLREKWREAWGERQLAEKSAAPLPEREMAKGQRKAYSEAVAELEQKNYAWTAKQFEEEITARGVGCGMTRERARELIAEDKTLLQGEIKTKGAAEAKTYYTTIKNYEQERGLFESVAEGRGGFAAALDRQTVESTMGEVCRGNGWELTAEQKNLVSHISMSQDNIIAVRGLAGVGKSFSLNAAREVLEKNGYEVMGAAPSGQAAKELAEDAGMEGQTADGATRCGTLQRVMNEAERRAGNAQPGQNYENKRDWNFDNIKAPAKPKVYLIDEAGMVDNNSMSQFFKMAEAERAAGGEVKIVLVGDDRQLPPVGTGNFFSDAVQREAIATAELTDIRRQQDPELLAAVREAVEGSPEKSLDILTRGGDIHEIKTPKGRISAIVKEYMSLSDAERAETLILSAKNADRQKLNEAIRAKLVEAGKVEQGKEYAVQPTKGGKMEARSFAKGDKIVFLKNDIKAGVRNGTQGTIEKIEGNIFKVNIGKEKAVSIDITKYNRIDHAYALTTYKAQGATVKRAIINMSSQDKGLNSRNAYYVNISRAKGKVSLYCDSKAKVSAQVKDFAIKLTGKNFNFAKVPKIPMAMAKPSTKAMSAAPKVIEGVAALVPPIPIIKPLLTALAKVASVATKAAELAMMPAKQAVSMGAKAMQATEEPSQTKEGERGRVLDLQPYQGGRG